MSQSSKALEFLRNALKSRISSQGFDQHLSKVRIVSGGDGKCVAKLKVEKEHSNISGLLHGGLSATLVDSISTLALMTSEKGVSGSTIDLKISCLRPIKLDSSILISANTVKIGRQLVFLSVQIVDEDTNKIMVTGDHIKYIGNTVK